MSSSILLNADIRGFTLTSASGKEAEAKKQRIPPWEIEAMREELRAGMEKELQEKLAEYRKRQEKLWTALESDFKKYSSSCEQTISEQLMELSLRIAEIILQHELPDRDMIRDIIRKTLEPFSDLQGVRVRMCPDDARDIKAARENTSAEDVSNLVEVVADTSLKSGDVFIESRNGFFDARITERLKLLKQKLMERQKNANANGNQQP